MSILVGHEKVVVKPLYLLSECAASEVRMCISEIVIYTWLQSITHAYWSQPIRVDYHVFC